MREPSISRGNFINLTSNLDLFQDALIIVFDEYHVHFCERLTQWAGTNRWKVLVIAAQTLDGSLFQYILFHVVPSTEVLGLDRNSRKRNAVEGHCRGVGRQPP